MEGGKVGVQEVLGSLLSVAIKIFVAFASVLQHSANKMKIRESHSSKRTVTSYAERTSSKRFISLGEPSTT